MDWMPQRAASVTVAEHEVAPGACCRRRAPRRRRHRGRPRALRDRRERGEHRRGPIPFHDQRWSSPNRLGSRRARPRARRKRRRALPGSPARESTGVSGDIDGGRRLNQASAFPAVSPICSAICELLAVVRDRPLVLRIASRRSRRGSQAPTGEPALAASAPGMTSAASAQALPSARCPPTCQ